MNLVQFFVLLQLATPPLGHPAQAKPVSPTRGPVVLVRNLYTQVVAHHPLGVPDDSGMKIFAPYLSKALLYKMDVANACGADWHKQHPEPDLKPALGWLELGPFSGENERASPQSFSIERKEFEKDGSLRVYVRLTREYPNERPSIWQVAAVLTRENGHFVLDDVIYLKDEDYDESRLSEALASGCDGPRWVGYDDQQSGLKQPR